MSDLPDDLNPDESDGWREKQIETTSLTGTMLHELFGYQDDDGQPIEPAEFDIEDEFNREVMPILTQLYEVCDRLEVPMFVYASFKRTTTVTESPNKVARMEEGNVGFWTTLQVGRRASLIMRAFVALSEDPNGLLLVPTGTGVGKMNI